jgi:hypothetical protein
MHLDICQLYVIKMPFIYLNYLTVRSVIEETSSSVERTKRFSKIAAVTADSRMSH